MEGSRIMSGFNYTTDPTDSLIISGTFPSAPITEGDSSTIIVPTIGTIQRVLNASRLGLSVLQSGITNKILSGTSQVLGFLNVIPTSKYVAGGVTLNDGDVLAGDSIDNTGAKRVALNNLIQSSGNITTASGAVTDWVEVVAPGKGTIDVTLSGTYGASTIVAEGKDAAGNWTLNLPLVVKVLGTQLAPTAGVYSLALAGGAPATVYNYLVPNAGQLSTRIRATAIASGTIAVAFAATSEAPHFTPGGNLVFNVTPASRLENQMGPAQGDNLGATLVNATTTIAGENLSLDVLGVNQKPINDTTFQWSVDQTAAGTLEASSQLGAAAVPVTIQRGYVTLDAAAPSGLYFLQCSNAAALQADGAFATPLFPAISMYHMTGRQSRWDFDFGDNGIKATTGAWIWVSTSAVSYTKLIITSNWMATHIYYKA